MAETYEDVVRAALLRSGWSTVEASRRSGVPQPTVSLFSRGLQGLSARNLERLCRSLGLRLTKKTRRKRRGGSARMPARNRGCQRESKPRINVDRA